MEELDAAQKKRALALERNANAQSNYHRICLAFRKDVTDFENLQQLVNCSLADTTLQATPGASAAPAEAAAPAAAAPPAPAAAAALPEAPEEPQGNGEPDTGSPQQENEGDKAGEAPDDHPPRGPAPESARLLGSATFHGTGRGELKKGLDRAARPATIHGGGGQSTSLLQLKTDLMEAMLGDDDTDEEKQAANRQAFCWFRLRGGKRMRRGFSGRLLLLILRQPAVVVVVEGAFKLCSVYRPLPPGSVSCPAVGNCLTGRMGHRCNCFPVYIFISPSRFLVRGSSDNGSSHACGGLQWSALGTVRSLVNRIPRNVHTDSTLCPHTCLYLCTYA